MAMMVILYGNGPAMTWRCKCLALMEGPPEPFAFGPPHAHIVAGPAAAEVDAIALEVAAYAVVQIIVRALVLRGLPMS